jgi:hypothetical protein
VGDLHHHFRCQLLLHGFGEECSKPVPACRACSPIGPPRFDKASRALGAERTDRPDTEKITTHPDARLHALRHTFLTEAAEYTDPFTLQYVAGRDNIKTTMRYVHPREAAFHKLFARLADRQRPEERIGCKKSVQNPVPFEMPWQN